MLVRKTKNHANLVINKKFFFIYEFTNNNRWFSEERKRSFESNCNSSSIISFVVEFVFGTRIKIN